VQAAESSHRHLMLAFTSRLNPTIRKAAEVVHSGALGKLYGAAMVYISDQTRLKSPEYQRSWFASKQKAGGGDLVLHGSTRSTSFSSVTATGSGGSRDSPEMSAASR